MCTRATTGYIGTQDVVGCLEDLGAAYALLPRCGAPSFACGNSGSGCVNCCSEPFQYDDELVFPYPNGGLGTAASGASNEGMWSARYDTLCAAFGLGHFKALGTQFGENHCTSAVSATLFNVPPFVCVFNDPASHLTVASCTMKAAYSTTDSSEPGFMWRQDVYNTPQGYKFFNKLYCASTAG